MKEIPRQTRDQSCSGGSSLQNREPSPLRSGSRPPSPADETVASCPPGRRFAGSEYPLYILSLAAFFAAWQWAGTAFPEAGSVLATPGQVLQSLTELSTTSFAGMTLPEHVRASAVRVLAGFAIAVAIGVPAGLGMAYSPVFRALFNPIFCLLKPMPPLAWISVAILWMGIGEAPKIFIIALGSIIPVILNS